MNQPKIHDRRKGPVSPPRHPGLGSNGRPRIMNRAKEGIAKALRFAEAKGVPPSDFAVLVIRGHRDDEPRVLSGPHASVEASLRGQKDAKVASLAAQKREGFVPCYVIDSHPAAPLCDVVHLSFALDESCGDVAARL